jgi:hypothetical protein
VRRDPAYLLVGECDRRSEGGRARGENQESADAFHSIPHSSLSACAIRSVVPPERTSNTSANLEQNWNARNRRLA